MLNKRKKSYRNLKEEWKPNLNFCCSSLLATDFFCQYIVCNETIIPLQLSIYASKIRINVYAYKNIHIYLSKWKCVYYRRDLTLKQISLKLLIAPKQTAINWINETKIIQVRCSFRWFIGECTFVSPPSMLAYLYMHIFVTIGTLHKVQMF